MLYLGLILLFAAAVCYFLSRSSANELAAMNAADTYLAQSLSDLHTRVSAAVGADALCEPCEVEGVIECDSPLRGPLSNQPCVAYTYSVKREYEERVTTKDAQGKQTTRTERRSETTQSDDQRTPFWVRDSSGRVLVNPEHATLDMVDSGNRFDPANSVWAGLTRTLGFRHEESALPVGTQVYVLGCAVDQRGQVTVARHPKGGTFMVSRKSERELARAAASSSKNFFYGAVGCGVLGVVLVLLGLVV